MVAWEDLLIIGDSYASSRTVDVAWPKQLSLKLTNSEDDPRGQGFAGCSWWKIREKIILECNTHVPKILIICHTESSRIPARSEMPLNVASVLDWKSNNSAPHNDHMMAAKQYFYYLHNQEFYSWAQDQWYKELDQLLAQYQIPHVIHLHINAASFYKFKYGITSVETLFDDLGGTGNGPEFHNHFSIQHNVQLARSLYEIVTRAPPYTNEAKNLNLLAKNNLTL